MRRNARYVREGSINITNVRSVGECFVKNVGNMIGLRYVVDKYNELI